MKVLILLGLFVAVNAISVMEVSKEEWSNFKAKHNKNYNAGEEKLRYKIYLENRHKIAKHNNRFNQKQVSFKMELNQFADMLNSEFVRTYNGYNTTFDNSDSLYKTYLKIKEPVSFIGAANVELPDAFDWRDVGAVTAVKNQGQCGSCWSFSATGALEGHHFRRTGKLVSLSEQNLVDCSSSYGNHGCHGGIMQRAFQYIKDNGGIDTEPSYPYEAIDNSCRFNKDTVGATDQGFVNIPRGDEDALKNAIGTIGPVTVAIDASRESFQFYSHGVYFDPQCSSEKLDHGVLVVGYGTENGQDYWIVKNSWATSWGDKGYIKMARNKNNACGVATQASYPLV